MSSDKKYVEYIVEQIENVGLITTRLMFGEYAVYCNGKVVALICNNQLFVKPTAAGRTFIGKVVEARPYHGAKPSFLIDDRLLDKSWLSRLIRLTVKELPEPKPKRKPPLQNQPPPC